MSALIQTVDSLLEYIDSEKPSDVDQSEQKDSGNLPVKIEDKSNIIIRKIKPSEFMEANQLTINTFSTFTGKQCLEADCRYGRKHYTETIVAVYQKQIVGVAQAIHLGSIRVWGPIAVAPTYWKNGICSMLCDALHNSLSDTTPIKIDALLTYSASYHIAMYMKFGFEPKMITYSPQFDINKKYDELTKNFVLDQKYTFKQIIHDGKDDKMFVKEAKKICDEVCNGFDLSSEIDAVLINKLGSCFGVYEKATKLVGFAVVHHGKISESTPKSGKVMSIKWAVTLNEDALGVLVFNIIKAAKERGMLIVKCGVNTGRMRVLKQLTNEMGFEYDMFHPAVACTHQRNKDDPYVDFNRSDCFVIGGYRGWDRYYIY
eukprot:148854_1